jgi:hypothetical protein
MLNVIMLNVIMLNVIMLNVIMLNVIILNVTMLNVIMLNVIMLNVMAPLRILQKQLALRLVLQLLYYCQRWSWKPIFKQNAGIDAY